MRRTAGSVLLLAMALAAGATEPRREIGRVEGVPVYADQIGGVTPQARAEDARRLFMAPILRSWMRAHAHAARPTPAQRADIEAAIERYATCSGNGYRLPDDAAQRVMVVDMLAGNIALQRRLYAEFGGGRLLFQQAGVEAFDATRVMLERAEAEGRLSFNDPETRTSAYDYWTRDHGAFMITEPAKIKDALDATSMIARCPTT
ncbi:MAG: hypothetical protein QM795_06655 [Pseudoxanthomonas sp.]